MPARSGRLEKRIEIVVPVQISAVLNPSAPERTTTENVSPLGVRLLAQRERELNERVIISTPLGNAYTAARVVYCQRLPGGRFAIGLEFQGVIPDWSKDSSPGTGD
jgi:hypothetical protein